MLLDEDMDKILAHYPHASAFQRWHMRTRLRLCPFDALLKHLTGSETVLDIGCGFGHFAWYLSEKLPKLRYHGSDIDGNKIVLAQNSLRAPGQTENASDRIPPVFHEGDARAARGLPDRFGNIVFLDVLYLMPWDLQMEMMRWALEHLGPGPECAMIVKTMDPAVGFSGFRTVAEEWIMVRLLGRTKDSGTINGARPFSDYIEFGNKQGFKCEVESLGTFNPSSILRFHR